MQYIMDILPKIGEWKYDAYRSLLSDKPTNLMREEVLKLVRGKGAIYSISSTACEY